MIERIKELMEYKGLSSTQFADAVDVPRAVISHILSGRNKPSLEVVTKIVSTFTDVDLNWILLGEGKMLKKLANKIAPSQSNTIDKAEVPDNTKLNNEKTDDDVKVQNQQIPFVPPLAAPQNEKEIEQIVIFYKDRSFIAYKP